MVERGPANGWCTSVLTILVTYLVFICLVVYLFFPTIHCILLFQAISQLPNEADLSCCSLERIPKHIFLISNLSVLNLCQNFMKERPILEEQTIGYIDDLNCFSHLRTLLLADNSLESLPLAIYHITSLTELDVSRNQLKELPAGIGDLQK